MRRYIRSRIGRTYYFTVATQDRRDILTTDLGRTALRSALCEIRAEPPFRMMAAVLLPDHFHTIWELPPGDSDYSTRWRLIKSRFSRLWAAGGGDEYPKGRSRVVKGEWGI